MCHFAAEDVEAVPRASQEKQLPGVGPSPPGGSCWGWCQGCLSGRSQRVWGSFLGDGIGEPKERMGSRADKGQREIEGKGKWSISPLEGSGSRTWWAGWGSSATKGRKYLETRNLPWGGLLGFSALCPSDSHPVPWPRGTGQLGLASREPSRRAEGVVEQAGLHLAPCRLSGQPNPGPPASKPGSCLLPCPSSP